MSLHATDMDAKRGGGDTVYLRAIFSTDDGRANLNGGALDTSVLDVMGLVRTVGKESPPVRQVSFCMLWT